eukprot:COSAG02_NODE_54104_length_298_cov_0.562814_1_plen_33_part_10
MFLFCSNTPLRVFVTLAVVRSCENDALGWNISA